MALYISGIELNGNGGSFSIINNSKTVSYNPNGALIQPDIPAAQIGVSGGGQTQITSGSWNLMTFTGNNLGSPNGGIYLPASSTSRFYPPITGYYHVSFNAYCNASENSSNYMHPIFTVNGALGHGRAGSQSTLYAIRGYGLPATSPFWDCQVSTIMYLTNTDYVEMSIYANGTVYVYRNYMQMNIHFLG